MKKDIIKYSIIFFVIPIFIVGSAILFEGRRYAVVSLGVAVLGMIPFFIAFEKDKSINSRRLVVLAVMITLSVLGRFLFAPLPFFKPVTAMVVITAIYLGKEAGFVCGAVSALISNIYFGQGSWTPFQMFVWGIIGFIAGMLYNYLEKSRVILIIYGIISGILYSLVMDIWNVLWWDGAFNIDRYIAVMISAIPVTIIYAVSNVLFLLILSRPIGKKLKRLKIKYEV